MSVLAATVLLLICSNVFMTFAWYGHLGELKNKPWIFAVAVSWGIAFFEYLIQVPANRIGHEKYNLSQLKIMQEVISLSVFVPIAVLFLKEQIRWDYLWAALCLVGAVYFVFRGHEPKRGPAAAEEHRIDQSRTRETSEGEASCG